MCLYDVTTLVDGTKDWGQIVEHCSDSSIHSGQCPERRIRKRIYDRTGRGYGGKVWVDPPSHTWSKDPVRTLAQLQRPCHIRDCVLPAQHSSAHEILQPCEIYGCSRYRDHDGDHTIGLRDIVMMNERKAANLRVEATQALIVMVIRAMSTPYLTVQHKSPIANEGGDNERQEQRPRSMAYIGRLASSVPKPLLPYSRLDLAASEIRFFELLPRTNGSEITGSFHSTRLSSSLDYVALSYTWGDSASAYNIRLDSGKSIAVRKNLWNFLRQQSGIITRPVLFWIDAICINQSDVHERNHQVSLMKEIYANATEVIIWLGDAANNSDLAVDFISGQAQRTLRTRGPGYYPVWNREVGKALRALCERRYWRRMWIIQEVLHAKKLAVWCGSKSFDWSHIESLYLKLKTLEDTNWFAHHEFHMNVMQSAAAVIVWQRAHYRHPDTPSPRLQTLIEIFRDWQCADVRDKVFALAGMAESGTKITPDYGLSTIDVYFRALDTVDRHDDRFASLLSQLLGLAERDVDIRSRDLYVSLKVPFQYK